MKINSLWVKIISALIVFMTPCFYVSASEDMVIQKYFYGTRQYKNGKFFPPALKPFGNIKLNEDGTVKMVYPPYDTSDNESKLLQEKHLVDIHLAVQQKANHVLATVSFHNRSHQSYFVHKNRLDEPKKSPFYPLCSHTFSISADGIILDYLSRPCPVEDDSHDEKSNWMKIPVGKTFSFTVILNDAYLFPTGNRRYNIGSMEFRLANNTYFYEKMAYRSLFSILEWKYYLCEPIKNASYLKGIKGLCKVKYLWKEDTAEGLIYQFDYFGLNHNNYFEARSNQVVIEIDGDKLSSFYESRKKQF